MERKSDLFDELLHGQNVSPFWLFRPKEIFQPKKECYWPKEVLSGKNNGSRSIEQCRN